MNKDWRDVDFRTYNHIFTNANQSSPSDNIRLGYVSPYVDMVFEPGVDTWFHFPVVPKNFQYDDERATSGIKIQDSGLIEDGAMPGYAPYCADRVYIKNVDYEWKDSGGAAWPKKMNNGVWLCAWLSGDMTKPYEAKWMDRWYDPEVVLKNSTEEYESIKDGPASASPGLFDVESKMTFRYGAQYKYHRISNLDIKRFVDLIDEKGLILHINDWTSAGCFNTAPSTSAVSTIRMYNTSPDMFDSCEVVDNSGDKGISFNGKSAITVDSDSTNQQGLEFSIVAFVEHDDWKNSPKGAIIDRGIHGGWEVGVSPNPYNNLICVLGFEKQTNQNSLSIYGPSFNLISTAKFPEEKRIIRVAVDDDYTVWGLRENDIVRIDINCNITNSCKLPDAMANFDKKSVTLQMLGGKLYGKMAVVCGPATEFNEEEDKEVVKKDTKFYIFDTLLCEFEDAEHSVSEFDYDEMEKTDTEVVNGVKIRGINGINTNSVGNGFSSWLEKEDRFEDSLGVFYRRRSAYDIDDDLSGERILIINDDERIFDLKVDEDAHVFVMTKQYPWKEVEDDGNPYVKTMVLDTNAQPIGGRLIKYIKDRDGHFYISRVVELPVTDWSKPAGIIISSYHKNGKNITVINAIMTDGYIIRYDTYLQRLWTTNISYYSGDIHTVANSYEWGRRFLCDSVYARATIGPTPEVLLNPGGRYLMTASLSNGLSDIDWHQIAFTRASDGFRLFIDSLEKDFVPYRDAGNADQSEWNLMYVANPNIVIGGDCGVGSELYEEHNMMDLFWNGKMDDVRIYNYALNNGDLGYLQMVKYDIQPMYWNMEIYDRYYVETVERLYKMKMPGSKSQNYDIVINGYALSGNDTNEFSQVKAEMAEQIKEVLPEITPAYAQNGRVVFNGNNTIARWK